MSINSSTYQLIANLLSRSFPEKDLKSSFSSFNHWERFVEIGSEQLLIPAIFLSLKKKDLLDEIPEDLRAYLKEIFIINENRNKSINTQLKSLNQLFIENEIKYILSKGCALIQYLTPQEFGLRMIGDIDILVEENQIELANDLLQQHGYREGNSFNYELKGFRHLNRLVHKDYIAAVELHRSVLNRKHQHLVPTSRVFNSSVIKNDFPVPSKGTLSLITILSAQINDKGDYYGTFNFKAIYDCIILELPEDGEVLSELNNLPVTHSFLGTAQYFFHDFNSVNLSKDYKRFNNSIRFKFKYPQLNKRILRIKWIYMNFHNRITIFLTNDSYRRHVFKNKIFPIFN